LLHDAVTACGARVVGYTAIDGYRFKASQAVVDGRFLGLALDQVNQPALTEARVDAWLARIVPLLAA
jgi:flavodoxin I